ncbi:MAG TPA: glycosyl transferase, group 1, partial [Thermoanaerobaculia bacterium]|nr:glycosyl transferase, group 1 [Thermoanaerobaculia bacterium]
MTTVCYILSHYISHRQAGLQFQDCFRRLGVRLVETPAEADLVIIHNEPWSVAGYYRVFPELREKRVVTYAVWETDQLPESYRFNLSLSSEIWTCSGYSRDALAQSGRPVSVVPHVVSVPEPNAEAERRMRERIGIRDGEM